MAQRRTYAPPRPEPGRLPTPEPLARAGGGQSPAHRRAHAQARPAPAAPPATPPAGGELQLSATEIVVGALPVALGIGQMLMDKSLDALPWVAGWTGVIVAYKAITAPGVRRGSLDWLVDSVGVGGELRRRLGVPDELPRVVEPRRARGAWGFFDGLAADYRNLQAAIDARRGIVEGAYTLSDEPAPGALRAAAVAMPARAARSVGGGLDEDIDGPDDELGEDVPDIGLPVVRLEDVANLDNLWVVGPKGSGKTTTVQALIRMRRGQHIALDPHGTPNKWPRCEMVGAGRDFGAIDRQIDRFVSWMDKRYKRMATGEVTEEQCKASRRTMVGDEWRAIRTALPGSKGGRGAAPAPGAAERLLDILTEGRKAGICVLTASHLDTAEGMGVTGEKDILKCFDMVVYLGAMATKHVPAAAAMARPAVVYDPEHNVWAQLILGDLGNAASPPAELNDEDDETAVSPPEGLQLDEPQAAPPQRQRKVAAAEGPRPLAVSARVPEPVADPLLAGLLAKVAPQPAPAAEPDIYASLSPERAARLRALQAGHVEPAASDAPKAEPAVAQVAEVPPVPPVPPFVQTFAEEGPDGRPTFINVINPPAQSSRSRRPKMPRPKRKELVSAEDRAKLSQARALAKTIGKTEAIRQVYERPHGERYSALARAFEEAA